MWLSDRVSALRVLTSVEPTRRERPVLPSAVIEPRQRMSQVRALTGEGDHPIIADRKRRSMTSESKAGKGGETGDIVNGVADRAEPGFERTPPGLRAGSVTAFAVR